MCGWCSWLTENLLNCVLCAPVNVLSCLYEILHSLIKKMLRRCFTRNCCFGNKHVYEKLNIQDDESDVEGQLNERPDHSSRSLENQIVLLESKLEDYKSQCDHIKEVEAECDRLKMESAAHKHETDEAYRRNKHVYRKLNIQYDESDVEGQLNERPDHSSRSLENQIVLLESKLEYYKSQCDHLTEVEAECDRLKMESAAHKHETDEAYRRLSEVMSSKLRDNNPNIVDLSDEFRPTKLAEISSELYDNEWTEAFTLLENTSDDRTNIEVLLDIFMTVYAGCKRRHEDEWNRAVAVFLGSVHSAKKKDIKYLKDMSKKNALSRLPQAQQACLAELRQSVNIHPSLFDDKRMLDYVYACVKLAWFAQFQDPPIVFVCPGRLQENGNHSPKVTQAKREVGLSVQYELEIMHTSYTGDHVEFNKTMYREYTRSGRYVEYVVWPAMLLHEGGPVLGKGVAQGCD